MSILDWFKNRPPHFESDGLSESLLRQAVDKAVSITNPRLKLLGSYQERLLPAVASCLGFIRDQVLALPAPIPIAESCWSSDPALRAFFAAPADITLTIGRSSNLRTLFEKYPALDEAIFVMVMTMSEQPFYGMSLQNSVLQRDSAQTVLAFADHHARICGQEDREVRRLLGTQIFEYLVSQALSTISGEQNERRELEEKRALIRARLRLLREQGPGLGSLFGSAPAVCGEQAMLEADLVRNEQALEALGTLRDDLEDDLETLREVLENPGHFMQMRERRLRVNTLNVVVGANSTDVGSTIDVFEGRLTGVPRLKRVFLLGRHRRTDMAPTRINFVEAARYL